MQWLGLIIPVIIAIIYKVKFSRDIVWWEYLSTLAIAVGVIWVVGFAYSVGIASDVKLVSGYVVGKEYTPGHWTEVCYYTGKTMSCHQVYVPPVWDIRLGKQKLQLVGKKDSNAGGENIGVAGDAIIAISENKYYKTQIGEIAVWEENFNNPLRRSKSNLYKQVIDKKYPNLDIPEIFDYYKINRITNISGVVLNADYNGELNAINTRLMYNDINLGFVISKYPEDFAEYNEKYWRGGNPNDFIIFIGVDKDGNIGWVKSVKWGNELLALEIRDEILKIGNISKFKDILEVVEKEIRKNGFVEADFNKFNYIQVQFPLWLLVIIYILTTITTVVVLEKFRINEYYN